MDFARQMVKVPIRIYQWTFRPLAGGQCRHWPTCSDYALQAIDKNGAWRGLWLMISRIVRCGPGGTSGVDIVPDIRAEHHTLTPWRYGRWRGVNGERADEIRENSVEESSNF